MDREKVGSAIRIIAAFVTMGLTGFVILSVCAVTLFKGQNLCRQYIMAWGARVILFIFRIRFRHHATQAAGNTQKVLVSNHTSTIDVIILAALGLPHTRFFMSKVTRKYLPLTLIGYLTGIFYIDTQDKPALRTACFQKAETTLRRTGESVYLSPEGRRITSGNIGRFNRGAFHLATNLKVPVQPFYIDIPEWMNPGVGLDARPGCIDIYPMPIIDTSGWTVENIDANKTRVRNMFIKFQADLKASKSAA